jgi:hypothetical protein
MRLRLVVVELVLSDKTIQPLTRVVMVESE